ncbi:MAG: putative molybdenum carrier protein [Verrucomicrobiae bacterium]|nr:putative molybdenum carrier protein [Verrucomicrobiae bacterium]
MRPTLPNERYAVLKLALVSDQIMVFPIKIISGGQTGADVAALDWAIEHCIPHGGWCPKGRKCEIGTIPGKYLLNETDTEDYAERTERNVVDSDGTVILTVRNVLEGGSRQTLEFAIKHNKPVLHLHAAVPHPGKTLAAFIRKHQIRILNVAGPRESNEPTVGAFVRQTLDEAYAELAQPW